MRRAASSIPTLQFAAQIDPAMIDDALPPQARAASMLAGRSSMNRHSAGAASAELAAVLVDVRTRLSHADLVRQYQGVEMGQRIRELTAKLHGVQLVGIAQQQQTIARLQGRHQSTHLVVGREHIRDCRIELLVAAANWQRCRTKSRKAGELIRPDSKSSSSCGSR